jgi:hypothetical protein
MDAVTLLVTDAVEVFVPVALIGEGDEEPEALGEGELVTAAVPVRVSVAVPVCDGSVPVMLGVPLPVPVFDRVVVPVPETVRVPVAEGLTVLDEETVGVPVRVAVIEIEMDRDAVGDADAIPHCCPYCTNEPGQLPTQTPV